MSIVDAFRADTLLAYATGMQPEITVPLNGESVLLGKPKVMASGDQNTQVLISGTGVAVEGFLDVYVGQTSLTYTRLDLGSLFKGIPVSLVIGQLGSPESLHAWLPTLSELHGVKLYPEDVMDIDFTTLPTGTLPVVAVPDSLNYTGQFAIDVSVPPRDLADLEHDLDVFEDTGTVSDFVYATVNGVEYTLPANGERLTKGVDFSQYSADLTKIAATGMTVVDNRTALCKILMREFGLPIDTITNTSINATTTALSDGSVDLYLKIPGKVDYLLFHYTP